jgi:hypothetical protein
MKFLLSFLLLLAIVAPAQATLIEVAPHALFEISGVPFAPLDKNIWVDYDDPAGDGGGDVAAPTILSVVFAPAVLDPDAVFAGVYEQEATPSWGLELAAFFVAADDLDPLYRLGYTAAQFVACRTGNCDDFAAAGIFPGSSDDSNMGLIRAAAALLENGGGYETIALDGGVWYVSPRRIVDMPIPSPAPLALLAAGLASFFATRRPRPRAA